MQKKILLISVVIFWPVRSSPFLVTNAHAVSLTSASESISSNSSSHEVEKWPYAVKSVNGKVLFYKIIKNIHCPASMYLT